jgi:hypothetical protein
MVMAGMVLLLGSGCGHTTVTKVRPGDYTTEGARYWLPAPYLLVTTPVVLNKEEAVVSFNPAKKELMDASYVAARPGAIGRPPVPMNEGDFESKAALPAPRARQKPAATRVKADKSAPLAEAAGPEMPELSVQKGEEPPSASAISIVWLPDYCEAFAATRQGLLTSEPLRVAFGDGWRLEAIDSSIKTGPLGATPPLPLALPAAVESDVRKGGPKAKKGPEAAEGTGIRFFKRVTTLSVKPGLYRVFTRDSCDKQPVLSDDILKASLQSVHYEELK